MGRAARGCSCAEGIVLGAGPAGSAAPLTHPPSLDPPAPSAFRFSRSPSLPRRSLIPGCTAPCFGGSWRFCVWLWSSLWEEPVGRAPPIGQRLFRSPPGSAGCSRFHSFGSPLHIPREGRASVRPGLSRGGPRPLRPAQEWGCGEQRLQPSAGTREDQSSSMLCSPHPEGH